MEEAFLLRIKLARDHLSELVNQCSTGLDPSELIRVKTSLKIRTEHLNKEIHNYISQSPNIQQNLVAECTQLELNAREAVGNLEAISYKNGRDLKSSLKLPKLELPTFNGDILKFHSFWDRYQNSVDNKDIEPADKMSYLVALLRGSAKACVQGLEVTSDNYPIAVDMLRKRFGNKEALLDAHYNAIHKLQKAASNRECRQTYDTIEMHLRVLQSLGEDTNQNHLRVIILSKFPDQIIYELKLMLGDVQDVASIRAGINKVILATETKKDSSDPGPSMSTEVLHVQTKPLHQSNRKFQADRKFQARSKDRKRRATEVTHKTEKRRRLNCTFCNGSHYNDMCEVYGTINARRERLNGKCFKCFMTGHVATQCRKGRKCYHCGDSHNRALCPKKFSPSKPYSKSDYSDGKTVCHVAKNNHSYLQTAIVQIKNNNKNVACRLLLDCGSQRSYLTSRMAKKLGISADRNDLLVVYTFGSVKAKEISSPATEIVIVTKRGIQRKIRVNIVPHITERIPVPKLCTPDVVDILADDGAQGETVDLLIGNELYFSFLSNHQYTKIHDHLYLINSDFGWIVSGNSTAEEDYNALSIITFCECHTQDCPYFAEPDLPLRNMDLKFLWAMESIGITDSVKTTREEEAINQFNSDIQYEEQRYQVKWPWIEYPPHLPTNYGLAYGRLKSLLQRSDKNMLKEYEEILKEQLASNIIEIVEPEPEVIQQTIPPIHYLPHHIVKQEGKRGRIVYDASAKLKDEKCLNECLYRGPLMLGDLTALLIAFRTNKVAITADVEKAFLQLSLQKEDRDVTRFLWLKDFNKPLCNENLLHLRFCRVPFGVISSPFLLTATLRYHMAQTKEELLTKVADKCYVDNLVTGAESSSDAVKLYNESRQVFEHLSMNLREWNSNNEEFLKLIPAEHRTKETTQTKVLGLIWNVKQDTLSLKIKHSLFQEEDIKDTRSKRAILSKVASVYDPCGFVSPLVLPAKTLLQEICDHKLKWDTDLPEDIKAKWAKVAQNLKAVTQVEIPRFVGLSIADGTIKYDLHCFTDASKDAYAAVIYLRTYSADQTVVSFIMSKSRVTSSEDKKKLNMPRLELLGCLIGNRLITYITNVIGITIADKYLWTDSLIVINWRKTNKLLPPFVARRINEIKQNKDVEMCYIKTQENPADIATRPDSWHLRKELWFSGPKFLLKNKEFWPVSRRLNEHGTICMAGEGLHHEGTDLNTDQEVGTTSVDDTPFIEERELHQKNPTVDSITSDVANMDVDDSNDKSKNIKELKQLQINYFPEESTGKETHLSRNLGLYVDVDGLLRCRGRMANTNWTYDMKHPILIPTCSEYTSKLIQDVHKDNYHVGVSHTLSIIRHNFWIPRGRAQVQKILRKCPQCIKHGGGPYKLPPTSDLPTERVNYSAPFTYTGVDYFGPVYISTDNGKEKRWICLYTCLAIRAIHMEIVNDMTADECLLALRRFVSSRGIPSMIVSDNALQFKLTSEVLSDSYCLQNKIKWRFIPQLAPWHGGFYERMVGLVKHCMKRTLEKLMLMDSQLLTVIKEIEMVVNTRPLTCVGSDVEHVLKPQDFLTLGKCVRLEISEEAVCTDSTATKQNLVDSWKRGQKMMNEFRRMFIERYLLSLRERYKHSPKQPRTTSDKCPHIGQLVQIKSDSKNRENWKVGKVSSLVPSADGEYRVARVRVGNSEFTRSIGHLYPLEVAEYDGPRSRQSSTSRDSGGIHILEENPVSYQNVEVFQQPSTRENSPNPDDRPIVEILDVADINHPVNSDSVPTSSGLDAVPLEDPKGVTQPGGEVEKRKEVENEVDPSTTIEDSHGRIRRSAAMKAREKIAEWTRQLSVILSESFSSSVGSVAYTRD